MRPASRVRVDRHSPQASPQGPGAPRASFGTSPVELAPRHWDRREAPRPECPYRVSPRAAKTSPLGFLLRMACPLPQASRADCCQAPVQEVNRTETIPSAIRQRQAPRREPPRLLQRLYTSSASAHPERWVLFPCPIVQQLSYKINEPMLIRHKPESHVREHEALCWRACYAIVLHLSLGKQHGRHTLPDCVPSFAPRYTLGASEGLFSPPSSPQQAAGYSAKENNKSPRQNPGGFALPRYRYKDASSRNVPERIGMVRCIRTS